jgi:hypothetical protein
MSDMTTKELTALKLRFYDALVCDPKLSAMDLRIAWLLLSRYLNAKLLVAWPSAETLARDLGSSVRGVRNSIQRLTVPGGWFKIEQGGGRRHSNVYAANFERVNSASPFQAETVSASSLKGEAAFPERVNSASPKSPLSKPIEEPFEGAAAHGADQKEARQGEILMGIEGGGIPNWPEWVAWLQELGMTEVQAARWLAEWADELGGGDEVDRRLQRIRDEGPTGQGGLNARMIAEGAVREPGQEDVA